MTLRRLATFAAAALLLLGVGASAEGRIHRLHRPLAPRGSALPGSLAVDETEYRLTPSHRVVRAGAITFSVYDRGMDAHDLTLVDPAGTPHQVSLEAGTSTTLRVTLPPGTYKVYCSLFAGTPLSHEDLGMVFPLEVR